MSSHLPGTFLRACVITGWFALGAALGVATPPADADARPGRGNGGRTCEDDYDVWDLVLEGVEADANSDAVPDLSWSGAAWLTAPGGDDEPVYFRSEAANLDAVRETR